MCKGGSLTFNLQVDQPGYKDANGAEVEEGQYITREDIVELLGYDSSEQAEVLLKEVSVETIMVRVPFLFHM